MDKAITFFKILTNKKASPCGEAFLFRDD